MRSLATEGVFVDEMVNGVWKRHSELPWGGGGSTFNSCQRHHLLSTWYRSQTIGRALWKQHLTPKERKGRIFEQVLPLTSHPAGNPLNQDKYSFKSIENITPLTSRASLRS